MAEVVLKGIPELSFETGHRFTPLGALAAVGDYLGKEAGYPWLMGLSGAAFRACWSDEWDLRMTYAAPEDLVGNGARVLGLSATNHIDVDPDQAWTLVRESLDGSMPVLSCGLAGAPEFCILHGYSDDPRQLRVRSYFAADKEVPFQPWIGWNYAGYGRLPLVLLEEDDVEAPAPEDSLRRALRFGRGEGSLAGTKRARDLHFGLDAYRAWREALEGIDGKAGDEEAQERKAFNMALTLNALLDARRTASEFLQVLAAMNPDWRAGLARAAEHYRHQVAVLGQARDVLYFPPREPETAAHRAAEDLANEDRRRRYVSLLGAALEEEKLSLDWIERVLEE